MLLALHYRQKHPPATHTNEILPFPSPPPPTNSQHLSSHHIPINTPLLSQHASCPTPLLSQHSSLKHLTIISPLHKPNLNPIPCHTQLLHPPYTPPLTQSPTTPKKHLFSHHIPLRKCPSSHHASPIAPIKTPSTKQHLFSHPTRPLNSTQFTITRKLFTLHAAVPREAAF